MEFKTNIHFSFKTRIKCPKCRETFDKPAAGDAPLRCPHCGAQLNIAKGATDEAKQEADAKVAEELGRMGVPLPERYEDIAKAKKITTPLNVIGGLVTAWALFFPFPYRPAIVVSALVPLASLLVMAALKGKISFETMKKRTTEPYLTVALAAPPLALAWRSLNDFHILEFSNVWVPILLAGVLFSIPVYLYAADVRKKPAYLLMTLIFGAFYGYGMLIEANCLLDRSASEIYTTRVLDKRASTSGEFPSYYITVSAWGPRTGEHEINIRKSGYARIKVNDEIKIHLKSGMLSVPWFIIQPK